MLQNICSPRSVGSSSQDGISIVHKWLIDVVLVQYVFGSLLFLGVKITVGQDVFSNLDILANLFIEENLVDLDVMSRSSLIKETWWEHHIVSVVPELNTILTIEGYVIS